METRNLRKERTGVITSNKMDKSITVAVKWKEKHPIYGKFVRYRKNYGNSSFEQNKKMEISSNNRKG